MCFFVLGDQLRNSVRSSSIIAEVSRCEAPGLVYLLAGQFMNRLGRARLALHLPTLALTLVGLERPYGSYSVGVNTQFYDGMQNIPVAVVEALTFGGLRGSMTSWWGSLDTILGIMCRCLPI